MSTAIVTPILAGVFLVLAAAVTMTVYMGLWIYNDAKERGIDNPAMWVVLGVVLSNFIGLIIYLVVRSTQGRKHPCASCGYMIPGDQGFCSRCGARQPPISELPSAPGKAKKYLRGLIISIVAFGLSFILIIAAVVILAMADADSGSFPMNHRYSAYTLTSSYQATGLKISTDQTVSEMTFKSFTGVYNLTKFRVTEGKSPTLQIDCSAGGGSLSLELRGEGTTFPLTQGANKPPLPIGDYGIYVLGQDARDGSVRVNIP